MTALSGQGPSLGRRLRQPSLRQVHTQATIDALIEGTIVALDDVGEVAVRVEAIVNRVGVSPGLVRYHFGDKEGLVDAARLTQFTRTVFDDVVALRAALLPVSSHRELLDALAAVIVERTSAAFRSVRGRQMANIAAVVVRPDYAERISATQRQASSDLVALFESLQRRAIIGSTADCRMIAAFVQTVIAGHMAVVIDSAPLSEPEWRLMIDALLQPLVPQPDRV